MMRRDDPVTSAESLGRAEAVGLPGEPLIDAERADRPAPVVLPVGQGTTRVALGACLVLIALNLRPVFSSVSALLPEIVRSTGLSPGAASLMTTLPVLCMGLFAPFAPRLALRFGVERTILWLLGLLAAGTALRGLGTVPALLAGATMAGAAIAVGNVLLPGLVKRDFPDRLALMTGLFTMALSGGAAAAAGLTIPIDHLFSGALSSESWPLALAIWALPVLVAFALWAPLTRGTPPTRPAGTGPRIALWGSGLAWQVTLFMGLQSAMAYCVFGYLAPILRERGLAATSAGVVVSASVAAQCAACLLAPMIAVRRPDQRAVNAVFFLIAAAGFWGCVFAPLSGVWAWALLDGIGQGGLIALAMTAIVLRSPDARTAANLSSMAQSVGYTLAAGGPLLVGLLRGATGSYAAAAVMVALIALAGAWCAWGAGRAIQIATPATNRLS